MEAVQEKKKPGNPNFTKSQSTPTSGKQRDYRFQLLNPDYTAKPREKETGEYLDNPYPPIKIIPNAGVAIDPKTKEVRNWRYVYGYHTIWVDEQKPEPTKTQLENQRNILEFNQGFLRVSPSDKAKLMALQVQDMCEGNETPLENKPKQYKMVDEDKEMLSVRTQADESFEAESAARSASIEEMLPVAMAFGIDVNGYETKQEKIRTQFILAAKNHPKAFLKQFVNPKNKVKYVVTMGLQNGIISSSTIDNKLVMVDTNKILFDIKSDGDVPEQVASMVIQGDEAATKLFEQLQKVLA